MNFKGYVEFCKWCNIFLVFRGYIFCIFLFNFIQVVILYKFVIIWSLLRINKMLLIEYNNENLNLNEIFFFYILQWFLKIIYNIMDVFII